jgi:hypothetical protein
MISPVTPSLESSVAWRVERGASWWFLHNYIRMYVHLAIAA